MSRSFKPVRGVAIAALCCGLFVEGCSPDQAATSPQGAMDSGKMEPDKKMEPGSGKMEPSDKMEPGSGKMEPDKKMEPGKMNP